MFQINQEMSTLILGIVTVIMAYFTKRLDINQKKTSEKVTEQSSLIEREKELTKSLARKNDERNDIMNRILLLIMKSNVTMLKYAVEAEDMEVMQSEASELTKAYTAINEEISELEERYAILHEMTESAKPKPTDLQK